MKIYLIGNPLVNEDNLPLRLKPDLEAAFPKVEFIEADPNENFLPEDNSIIIDTVHGLKEVTIFNSLDDFADHPLISPHDYDLFFHLKLLIKLGKVKKLTLIGIPQGHSLFQILSKVKNFMLLSTVT